MNQIKKYKKSTKKQQLQPLQCEALNGLIAESLRQTFYLENWPSQKQQNQKVIPETNTKLKKQPENNQEQQQAIFKKMKRFTNKLKGYSSLKKIDKQSNQQISPTIDNKDKKEKTNKNKFIDVFSSVKNQLSMKSSHGPLLQYQKPSIRYLNNQSGHDSQRMEYIQKIACKYSQKKLEKDDNTKQYLQKIRKMSLPWLRTLPKKSRAGRETQQQLIEKGRQRIDQKSMSINKKIKRNYKYILNKRNQQSQRKSIEERNHGQEETRRSSTANFIKVKDSMKSNNPQQQKIQLLKKWMQMNHTGSHQNVSSLLREHYSNKVLQKQRQKKKRLINGIIQHEQILKPKIP